MPKKCETCKYAVIGKYSHLYGGRPIGCAYPNDGKYRHCRKEADNIRGIKVK